MINLDIIILIHNQLQVTKKCLQSIQQYTNAKYNFIIVDNNSTDGSEKWIRKFCKKYKIKLSYIRNKTNRGVPKGWNQGIKKSTSEYIAILNNDIIVTPNWEMNLMNTLMNFPNVLLAYPNSIQSEFTVENIANSLKQFSFSVEETEMFAGYCFMIKRQCLKDIGLFDERFTPFLCEDTDYAYRLLINKTPAVKVYSSFIYHLRSKTLNTVRYTNVYERNKKKLMQKYSDELDINLSNLTFKQQSVVMSNKLNTLALSIFDAIHEFVDTQETLESEQITIKSIQESITEVPLERKKPAKLQQVYKITAPLNFSSSHNVKRGETVYFIDKPSWAHTDTGIVVEKITITEDELATIMFEDMTNQQINKI